MIYLDASAAATSPANCGIPRTTRRIYEALGRLEPVTPLVWSKRHRDYCRLSSAEQGFLTRPFARHTGPLADPVAFTDRERWEMGRYLGRWWRRVGRERLCQAGDTLLLPRTCGEDQSDWLDCVARDGRLRLVAVLNDAIAFSKPDLMPGFSREFEATLWNISRCSVVITCSEESREAILSAWRELGCRAAPVIVEPWPMEFGPRGRADLSGVDRRKVLCVSSLLPRKNHATLFAACQQLWDEGMKFELDLIGRQFPDSQGSRAVVEAVQRLESQGCPVRWLKHVPDEALAEAYANCSFTVYPSLAEGFGLPIHESLWFGRPCICGTNGALGEVSAGGGCLSCDQTRPESLATALRQLLTDCALYAKLSQEAERRQFRSWREYAASLRGHLAGYSPG